MQSIIVSDSATIQDLVREAVAHALKTELPDLVRKATTKPFLTNREVQELTGWSKRKLQHLRDTKQIDFVQDGRNILYPASGLESFIARRTISSRKRLGAASHAQPH